MGFWWDFWNLVPDFRDFESKMPDFGLLGLRWISKLRAFSKWLILAAKWVRGSLFSRFSRLLSTFAEDFADYFYGDADSPNRSFIFAFFEQFWIIFERRLWIR